MCFICAYVCFLCVCVFYMRVCVFYTCICVFYMCVCMYVYTCQTKSRPTKTNQSTSTGTEPVYFKPKKYDFLPTGDATQRMAVGPVLTGTLQRAGRHDKC